MTNELTPREQQIWAYIGAGWQDKRIAYELGISEATISGFCTHLYRKKGFRSRNEAIVAWYGSDGSEALAAARSVKLGPRGHRQAEPVEVRP